MKPTEPELAKIAAGAVTLGVPAWQNNISVQHRWIGPRRVQVGEFQIGRYAVTREEYSQFLTATGHVQPADWDDPVLGDPRQPACGVSAEDADAYCLWLRETTHKPYRLPGVDEWEKAARGGLEGKIFPWGDDNPVGRCFFGLTEKAGQ